MNHRCSKVLLILLVFLLAQWVAVYPVYSPNLLFQYLLSSIPFLLVILWADWARPLAKFPALRERTGLFKFLYFLFLCLACMGMIQVKKLSQSLGGFALAFINLFFTLSALTGPVAHWNRQKKADPFEDWR